MILVSVRSLSKDYMWYRSLYEVSIKITPVILVPVVSLNTDYTYKDYMCDTGFCLKIIQIFHMILVSV